jgi:hypothetical protein
MDRRQFVAGALTALTGATAAAGTATAQQSAASTETPTPTEAPEQTRVQLGPALTIADYRYRDGKFRIDFRADALRRVTVTDVGAMVSSLRGGDGARAVEIPFRTATVARGEERVTIATEQVDGESMVTVATSETLVLLRSGALDSRGQVDWSIAQMLMSGTAIGTGGVIYRRMKRDDEEPEEVERLA